MASEFKGDNGPQSDEQGGAEEAVAASTPVFMYVHYLVEHSANKRYPMYLFQLESPDLAAELEKAIDDIVGGNVSKIPRKDEDIQRWRVFSYVAFVLKNDTITSVELFDEDGGTHSFDEVGTFPNYRNHSTMVFINKRENKWGRRLRPRDKEKFTWFVNHRRPTHESSTTNTGP